MSNPSNSPTARDITRLDAVNGTLSKAVIALAIEPLTMALTLNGRKAYDVMLWLAQRMSGDADGGYTSSVGAIVRGYGGLIKHTERVQRYIEQMTQTTVVWRPLATNTQQSLPLDGMPTSEEATLTQEVRTFTLLAEARTFVRHGQAWVTWYYPPSIREQLISPDRWAQIELKSIARLSTYTAVALYEICARYKDSPGGLTSRHTTDFWVAVLREGGDVKAREYRKFKHELLRPAITEINECTEIDIDVIEHKKGRAIDVVQFKVARKARRPVVTVDAVDVTLALRAANAGVRESDLDTLLSRHGEAAVDCALLALESQLAQQGAPPILNRAAYLRKILANQDRSAPTVPTATQPTSPTAANAVRNDPVKTWMDNRLKAVAQEFSALDPKERGAFIDAYLEKRRNTGKLLLPMIKRLAIHDWESPLVRHGLLTAFAAERYGDDWDQPKDVRSAESDATD